MRRFPDRGGDEDESTARKRIIELLLGDESPLTAEDITLKSCLRTAADEVCERLKHVVKTLRRTYRGSHILITIPPVHGVCGHVFMGLREPGKPSGCPKCKSDRVDPPAFKMVCR